MLRTYAPHAGGRILRMVRRPARRSRRRRQAPISSSEHRSQRTSHGEPRRRRPGSSRPPSGKELYHWKGTDRRGGFGGVVAPVGGSRRRRQGRDRGGGAGDRRSDADAAGRAAHLLGRHREGAAALVGKPAGRAVRTDGGRRRRSRWRRRRRRRHRRTLVSSRSGDDRVGRVELRSGRSGAVLAELFGDEADGWFGWHIRRAPDPDGHGRPALLIGSLRHPVDGKVGVGVLDLYVLRAPRARRSRDDDPRRASQATSGRRAADPCPRSGSAANAARAAAPSPSWPAIA